MNHCSGPHRVFHFGFFGRHAESLVKMGMKHLGSLLLEPADDRLALLLLVNLTRVDTLAATTRYEDQRLMCASRIDQSAIDPRCARPGSFSRNSRIEGEGACRSQFAHGDATGHDPDEVPAVDHLLLLVALKFPGYAAALLSLQNTPHCPGEDLCLGVGWYLAGVQHFVITGQRVVEFLKISAKNIRAENQLLECAVGRSR